MTPQARKLFTKYAATKATVVSGTLIPNEAVWLGNEVYPSLEAASRAARTEEQNAGKVHQIILHLPGGSDKPLTAEEMRVVLHPQREYLSVAIRSGLRLANDILDDLENKFTSTAAEMQAINRLGSSIYYRSLRDTTVVAFRDAGRVLIRQLVSAKQERARNRLDELIAAMDELALRSLWEFEEAVSSSRFQKPEDEIAELQADIARAKSRMLLDFEEGVFHLMTEEKGGSSINIVNHGQIAGHVGEGNAGNLRVDQRWNDTEVFSQLAAVVQAGVLNEQDRTELLAAVEDMRAARDDSTLFARAYGAFLGRAAVYMTIIGPFLPALGQILERAR